MELRGSGRAVAVGALVCALLAVAAAPGVASVGESATVGPVAGQAEPPANATVRHEDPAVVDRPGDLAAVERYLAGRMGERLEASAASIGRGEYEAARSLVGDEYDGALARYVDVTDDGAAGSFREAGEGTRELADSVGAFEETDEAYRRASERGDEERARALGRRLIERSRAVDRTRDRLEGTLRSIEDDTGRDTSAARARVENVSDSVRARARAVARETFVGTRLEATAAPGDASFLRPTTVRGRLVTENGTGLAGETIVVGAEGVRAETNDSGAFAATYRPVRLPADARAVPVTYAPANTSGYLGDRTNASVSVTPVTPAVTAETSPDAAAYGDRVFVTGSVVASDVPVAGVPVVASVDGVTLGRAVTDAVGGYALSGRLPASVPDGDREVAVRVDQTGRAVATASAAASVSVEPTATELTLSGSVGPNGTAALSGRLRTADGRDLGDRTVSLLVSDEPVGTVTTDASGAFSARVPSRARGESLAVAARFDGRGTSLASSSASATLDVPDVEGDGGSGVALAPRAWLVVLVLVGLLAAGGLLLRRRGSPSEGTGSVAGPARQTPDAGATTRPAGRWREAVAALLEAGETDRAVERTYGAVRERLTAEAGATGALTHWEFYAAVRADGVGAGRVEALLELTEAYEQARFAPGAVTAADAAAALERADAALSG